jgi:hypothetical protein
MYLLCPANLSYVAGSAAKKNEVFDATAENLAFLPT